MKHAAYLEKLFDRKKQTQAIYEIKKIIKEKNLKFDGFVVIGVSGIVMGAILSRVLNKELVIVRKPNDGTHSSYYVENFKNGKRYIFLDDLISSGSTYKTVKNAFDDCSDRVYLYGYGDKSKIVGCILYDPIKSPYTPCYLSPQMIGKIIKSR